MVRPKDQMTKPVLSASNYVQQGDERSRLPERVVLVFDESALPRRGRRKHPAPFRGVVTDKKSSVAVVLASGPGGPTAAVTMELLATLGVTSVVAVGLAASLRLDFATGSVMVAGDAVADECVSKRYGGHLEADPGLTASLCEALGAPTTTTATTDVPFRQFPHDVARLAHHAGVLEMEGAVLFAAAAECGIRCGLVLVVSDLLAPSGWIMGNGAVAHQALTTSVATARTMLEATP